MARRHGEEEAALLGSLKRLQTSYLDLFLIQSPKGGSILWTWDALLQLRARGLARAVGLCHLTVEHLQSLAHAGRELPEVLQAELHVANQQPELQAFCRQQGIALVAAAPLGRGAVPHLPLPGPRSAAEVGLRWALQRGLVAIPKSSKAARLEANAAFGFSLSQEVGFGFGTAKT